MNLFENHSVLVSGLLVALGAFVMNSLRAIPSKISSWLIYRTSIRVEFPDATRPFAWVDNWLGDREYIGGSRNVGVRVTYDAMGKTVVQLVPAPGTHYLFYRGRPMIVRRFRKEFESASWSGKTYAENISLRFFFAKKELIQGFLDEAQSQYEVDDQQISVFTTAQKGECWRAPQKRMIRPLKSVLLSENLKQDLIEDIEIFRQSKSWYQDAGIPYRRGYLLHGPPGNGKTSIVKSIAGHYGLSISILTLNQTEMDDSKLQGLIDTFPRNSILVLEDVDCLFQKREGATGVSLSGLLNALDGVASRDDYMLFLTTNYPELLDGALTREGRVDKKVYVGNATPQQASEYFLRFLEDQDAANRFGELVGDGNHSMASVQELLLQHRQDPRSVLRFLDNGRRLVA